MGNLEIKILFSGWMKIPKEGIVMLKK